MPLVQPDTVPGAGGRASGDRAQGAHRKTTARTQAGTMEPHLHALPPLGRWQPLGTRYVHLSAPRSATLAPPHRLVIVGHALATDGSVMAQEQLYLLKEDSLSQKDGDKTAGKCCLMAQNTIIEAGLEMEQILE